MKYYNYLLDKSILEGYLILLQDEHLYEMSDDNISLLKSFGDKLGLRISKSQTVFSLLGRASKNISRIVVLATKYHYYVNVKYDADKVKSIKNELDSLLARTNRKEIMSFFSQLDASTLSLLTIPKNILQSVFGIEISTYNDWLSDKDYILTSLEKIKKVLMNIPDNNKETRILDALYQSIKAK